LSTFRSKLKCIFDPIVKKANDAKKEAADQRKAQIDPIEQAENIIKQKCKDYENERERRRLETEEKMKAKAKADAEQQVKDDKEFAEAHGLDDDNEEPSPPAPEVKVKVKPTIEKVTGLGIRRTWKYRITDEAKIPREFLKIDNVKIGEAVRQGKDKTSIEGIEAYYE
ncbi:MAG: hypothetical protein KAJ51_11575, partial [Thermoplasmata archaeon]|nr:hypothetical protein [Thermoplasmata archaeon]